MALVGRLGRAALAHAMPAVRAATAPSAWTHLQQKSMLMAVSRRAVSSTTLCMHTHKEDDEELVALQTGPGAQQPSSVPIAHHDHDDDHDDVEDEDDEDLEDMVAIGPSGKEWGGPTRGGKFKEPTRYGDWERKGRCSDF